MSLRRWVYAVTWHMFGIWIGKCMLIKLGFGKEEYGFKKNGVLLNWDMLNWGMDLLARNSMWCFSTLEVEWGF